MFISRQFMDQFQKTDCVFNDAGTLYSTGQTDLTLEFLCRLSATQFFVPLLDTVSLHVSA